MPLESNLEQTIKQQLGLSARQIESLEILSMNTMELVSYLEEEQLSNPMLEVEDTFPGKLETYHYNSGQMAACDRDGSRELDVAAESVLNLQEYLTAQFPIQELSEEQLKLLVKMVTYIDEETGYFTETVEQMKDELQKDKKQVEEAFILIRSLEPAGVGATDMRDCLLLQLQRKNLLDDTITEIIRNHLDQVAGGKISSISRALKISTEKVRQYIIRIQSLNPKPAQIFGRDRNPYIVPDVRADYRDGRWEIQLMAPSSKIVHLNKTYMKMAEEATEPELVLYFSEKIKRAKDLLVAAEQREDTMRNMIQILLEVQTDYALGIGPKKFLTQRSIAEELRLHPSTVNRAVKNKYIQMPGGVIPLNELFSSKKNRKMKINYEKQEIAMPGQVTEICLIAPTKELMKQNEKVCVLYGKNVDAFHGSLSEACAVVKDLLQKGAKVFISRKGTKKLIEEQAVPIVEIGLSLSDYIPLMERARRVKGKVAFFSYGIISEDVRSMCYLLGIDALFYSFYRAEQCLQIVETALEDGAVLGIGGADSAMAAKELGLEHLTVENSEQSLLNAIESAEQLLEVQREEAKKQEELKIRLERYEMVFNYTHDAIIAVNEEGMIDVLNLGAEKIIKSGKKPYQGKRIDDVIPNTRLEDVIASGEKELNQLMTINGTMVSTNRLPIVVEGKVKGAVATFQDIKVLQSNEQKIRLKLHEKGLVAKYRFSDIIGESQEISNLIRMAEKFAKSDATILIYGETGTGKELLAQSIHNSSSRKDGPFVAVNCGSLPRNILESELFGYVDGAFTGASKGGKMGLFEMAHGGTIFLDEIGEMPMETQAQLLRVLQEKEIRRLGSDRVTPVDIRVITATNRDLKAEIGKNNFREDLFYRLNVLNLEIRPLRKRQEDIVPIGVNIFNQFAADQKGGEILVREILGGLKDYAWPGNVREVHNLVERIYVLYSQGEEAGFIKQYIRTYLDMDIPTGKEYARVPEEKEQEPASQESGELQEWEKEKIIRALKENNLEVVKTAESLGISRSTLWRKIKKYQITL